MIEQNLFKLVFSNENGVIANVIACSDKGISENEAIDMVLKEVIANYCEDNHCPYDDILVRNMSDSTSVQKLGTFRPDNDDYCNDDFTIITLSKTKRWKVN